MQRVSFYVEGMPRPKPAWNRSARSARGRHLADPWYAAIRKAGRQWIEDFRAETPVFAKDVPLVLTVTFCIPVPVSQGLPQDVPPYPVGKPDLTNLIKGLEDVLGVWPRGGDALFYEGDEQIVEHVTRKVWEKYPPNAGAHVELAQAEGEPFDYS